MTSVSIVPLSNNSLDSRQPYGGSAANRPPVGSPMPNQEPVEDVPHSFNTSPYFSDPDGDVLTFTAANLVPGLTIDSASGVISGTAPTPGQTVTVVRATDPGGLFDESSVTYDVQAVDPPAAGFKTEFPRLGGAFIGVHAFDVESNRELVSNWDVSLLGMFFGWQANGWTPQSVSADIKARNPNIKLGEYTNWYNVPDNAAFAEIKSKVEAEDWTLNDENGTPIPSTTNNPRINPNNVYDDLSFQDGDGKLFSEWYAEQFFTKHFDGGSWDFWYSDNTLWRHRYSPAPDWNRDGSNSDGVDNAENRETFRNAMNIYWDHIRQIYPGMMIFGNPDGKFGGDGFTEAWLQSPEHSMKMEACFMEGVGGLSWAFDKYHSFDSIMSAYRADMSNMLQPKICFFHLDDTNGDFDGNASGLVIERYQYIRYMMTMCLMDDGYFTFNRHFNNYPNWLDEYDLAGTSNTSWLGNAIDGPQLSPWQNGLYKREFQNGAAVCNPKGNGIQTFSLPGFSRFSGNQDSGTNNGQPATNVTLGNGNAARDGILLVRD